VLVKGTIWAVSLGSGTSGGVLAPLLIMGAALGGILAPVLPNMGLGFWQLVAMGAILGGTMRSPLTGVVFALELTHDVDMMLPLLIAVTIAHGFTVLVLKRSILTEKVARRGFHLSREYAIDPLEILFVREVMGQAVAVLPAGVSHDEIAESRDGARRGEGLFYVIDRDDALVGVVSRKNLDEWANESSNGGTQSLVELAKKPVTAFPDEPLRVVVHRMADTGYTQLPVVDRDDPRKIVGKITLKDLLKARVRHLEEERRRERALPLKAFVPRWLRSASVVPPSVRPRAR
jgi:CIC family chloride channel protein